MRDKAIENYGTLESIRDFYKNQQMCNIAVDNYTHALKYFPDSFKTQEMYNKAVNIYHSTIQFVPEY